MNEKAIARLIRIQTNQSLVAPSSIEETEKAINLLSSGKAPGSEAILAEIYITGGPCLIKKMDLLQSLWNLKAIPQEFNDANPSLQEEKQLAGL